MFKEITVLLLAIAIVWVVAATYRMRSKSYAGTLNDEPVRNGDDDYAFAESLTVFTLPQLENKVQKLEQRLKSISKGFVSMNRIQQQQVIEAATEIKKKISIINEAVERRRLSS